MLVLGHAEAAFARNTDSSRRDRQRRSLSSNPWQSRSVPKATGQRAAGTVTVEPSSAAARSRRSSLRAAMEPPREPRLLRQGVGTLLAGRRPPAWETPGSCMRRFAVCGEYLQRVPDSAEGHFLLGVLHDALGHSDLAVSSFRKALYLGSHSSRSPVASCAEAGSPWRRPGAALLRARARARDQNAEQRVNL